MINLSKSEVAALSSVDEQELSFAIDHALSTQHTTELRRMSLSNCGLYVSKELSVFEKRLGEYRSSKSAKKRERTYTDAMKAGSDLSFALSSMKQRMKRELADGELFYVDDHIFWPHSFTENMSVTVSYRWRRRVEDEWNYGRITFEHTFRARPEYATYSNRRKPSAARQKKERQEELERTWEHLKNLALYAVRDYFRGGGGGDKIPSTVQAVTDRQGFGLNNFSAQFWNNS